MIEDNLVNFITGIVLSIIMLVFVLNFDCSVDYAEEKKQSQV